MPRELKLKFDPNQQFQVDAVDSIVDLFEGAFFGLGSPDVRGGEFRMEREGEVEEFISNDPGFGIDEGALLNNLHEIQLQNGLHDAVKNGLDLDAGHMLEDVSNNIHTTPHFTVEMETGTGKTYVYLRTIHELHRRFGFSKFIVVVPSVAIYEGVIKSFRITEEHFIGLFGNDGAQIRRYDGSRLSDLRSFATSTRLDVMVMTIDSFNRKANTLYKPSEQLPGEYLPYEYLQKTRPIVIVDEPQSSISTEKAKSALRTLTPFFALRFSATHKESPNLIYRLTPFDAFEKGLVKRIQVFGITEEERSSIPSLDLLSVKRPVGKGKITALIRTEVMEGGALHETEITLKQGDDLGAKTKRPDLSGGGYIVAEISSGPDGDFVEFQNGERIKPAGSFNHNREMLFREQIRQTIWQHMELQRRLLGNQIKVLSLFFIDRVANYVADDGIIRQIFDEEFNRLKNRFEHYRFLEPDWVREGYFAKKREPKTGAEVAVDTEGRTVAQKEQERQAFELIMRDKERLLSFSENVAFIFAHSALKEGWDNPNVFQICTLNQTVSEMKKRQEIGRGLRLCVNQNGERVFNPEINILTIVANDSYLNFASSLQEEYREEGLPAPPRPTNANRPAARRRDHLFTSDGFQKFWEKLSRRVTYQIDLDSEQLVNDAVRRLNEAIFPESAIVVEKGNFNRIRFSIKLLEVQGETARIAINRSSTEGWKEEGERSVKGKDDLEKIMKEKSLRGFRLSEVVGGVEPSVSFGNGVRLLLGEEHQFEVTKTGLASKSREKGEKLHFPVGDIIGRGVNETGLTRKTLTTIFNRMSTGRREKIFTNPEGFAALFFEKIESAVADHIAENITFTLQPEGREVNLEEQFPAEKRFPQHELVEGGEKALYDFIQIDSEVERRFVHGALKYDEEALQFYFKFPSGFKFQLPRFIGNYNPDWGIVRIDPESNATLELVRETKGSTNFKELQFAHEKRKIACAVKLFKALGVDYDFQTDEKNNYWERSPLHEQISMYG